MTLSPGTRIGVYEITTQIGEGGMGQVYRARDMKLDRDVAIKILPDAFAHDADRLARFQREAKTLASLNHPNIAAIYGLEEGGGTAALVMELAEGEDLSQRIARGAIPIDEALPMAKQIAEALEAAHEQGIIHRDLKPANIKVRPDGTVKVLDFGLAKWNAPNASSDPTALSMSPTITSPAMTRQGIILGTAAYMSPEQARGRTADKRADIWAFGVVVFEMLTGHRAFEGDDISIMMASVLTREPEWSTLPSATPTPLRRLLVRCLKKDPRARLRDIGEARILVEELSAGGAPDEARTDSAQPHVQAKATWLPWAVAGAATLGAVLALWAPWRKAAPAPDLVRLEMPPPSDTVFGNSVLMSPDGRHVAFTVVGQSDATNQIWVRSLDTLQAHRLAPTTQNAAPFWSPDSRFIVFQQDDKLKKVDIAGGPPLTLSDAPMSFGGGAWSHDVIVFGDRAGGLKQVSAAGGMPMPLTALDAKRQEISHALPSFLPDGTHFVYFRRSVKADHTGIYVGSMGIAPDRQDSNRLLASESAAVFTPAPDPRDATRGLGFLLFLREGTLVAQPFDAGRLALKGDPVPIAEDVGMANWGRGRFSASQNGGLAYSGAVAPGTRSRLLWFDRQGKQVGEIGPPEAYGNVALSPDGRLLVVDHLNGNLRYEHLWSADTARGVFSRVNPGDALDYSGCAVAPDGRVAFTYVVGGAVGDIYVRLANGAGTVDPLVKSATLKHPNHWSLDGRFLIYDDHTSAQKQDLWIVPMAGDRKPVPFLATPADETDASFSPDTRWVAYSSDESGRREVYVQGFVPDQSPAAGVGKWQISTAGGAKPRWRRDGKELYYIAADGKLMAVPVTSTATTLGAGVAAPLFETRTRGYTPYDIAPDGRFLINTVMETATVNASTITVVLNWTAGLKQ